MPGRPPKYRPPSSDRAKLIGQILSDVGNYRSETAREAMEEKLGRPLTENEWRTIGTPGRGGTPPFAGT